MSSSVALLVSLASLAAYSYAVYFMFYDSNLKKMSSLIPKELHKYSHWKFLTFQCLLIQTMNSLLHVGACFSRSLERPRDLFFSALAYPVGSIVVYSFWAVWHLMGRELIFPAELSQYYPDWLNHVTHTMIAPLNILMALLVRHQYSKNGAALTVGYLACYTGLLLYIKQESGVFVYRYLETMGQRELTIYFASTGLFAYLMYKSGQLLSSLAHSKPTQRPALKKKQK